GDFIVGFPGETDSDFADTIDLVERVGYASAFSFKYSPRPGTPGAGFDDQIDEAVKTERLARLQNLLASQQTDFNRSLVGKRVRVLFEKPGRKPGQLAGRSPWLQAVHVEAPADLIGRIAVVEIIEVTTNSLLGRLTSGQDQVGFDQDVALHA